MRAQLLVAAATAAVVVLAPPAPAEDGETPAGPPATGNRTEPTVAVHPSDPNHVVTASIDAGTGGVAAYVSRDGGRRFTTATRLPHRWDHQADPGLAFDSRGRLYASYLDYNSEGVGGRVAVARSADGVRWEAAGTAVSERYADGVCLYPDFSSIAIDASSAEGRRPTDTVYVAWQDLAYEQEKCGDELMDTLAGNWLGTRVKVARSTDGGRTFSAPVEVPAPEVDAAYVASITVAPDGNVLVAFMADRPRGDNSSTCSSALLSRANAMIAISSDGARSFRAHPIQRGICVPGMLTSTGAAYRQPATINLAVSPRTGTLAAALTYDDGAGRILSHVMRSTDGGRDWEEGGPIGGHSDEEHQFARIAASPRGAFAVAYLSSLPGALIQAHAAVSHDDGTSWSVRPIASARHAGNVWHWIGDYIGIAVGRDGVAHPVWTDTRGFGTGFARSIWTRRVPTDR